MLEIIATSIEDVVKISSSDADRIELCVCIEKDGFTPKISLVKKALEISSKPINIMIRNENSFLLSDSDEVIRQIKEIKSLNAPMLNGFVLGFLKGNSFDSKIYEVIETIGNYKVTFHRACDYLNDIKILNQLKIDSVLSSGEPNNLNISNLKSNVLNLDNINVIIGGGVSFDNIKSLLKVSNHIHVGSAVRLENSFEKEISVDKINEFAKIIKSFCTII